MEQIKIREVTAGDGAFLSLLMNHSAVLQALHEVSTAKEDWAEAVSLWLEDKDEKGYILFDGKRPIGWFAVNGLQADGRRVFLKMAVLLPEYQGRGIGAYVLKMIWDELKAAGFGTVVLFTDQSNVQAQKCYRKCGFTITEALKQEMPDGVLVSRYKMERGL